MRELFLLRHAKSVTGDPDLRDFDRPLSEPGKKEAQRIGKYIKQQDLDFALLLSSPAVQARETAELVLKSAQLVVEVRYDPLIYEAGAKQLLAVISHVEDEWNSVLLVGHNPGIEELLHLLTDRSEHMSTASLARVNVEADGWRVSGEGKSSLEWLVTQKDLADY
jgi:phosphohistidine phosphatase